MVVVEGGSPGGPSSSSATPTLADPTALVAYIKRIAFCILEEEDQQAPTATTTTSLGSTLNEATDVIRKFIADPMAKSLFVQKISNKGE